MTMRPLIAAAAAACVVTALPAHAATRPKPKPKPPSCNLVTDPEKDAGAFSNPGGATYDAGLDVLSADVATNAKSLTWVVRLKKLSKSDTMSPGGQRFTLSFTVGTSSVGLFVNTDAQGKVYYPTGATGTFYDEAKSQLRFTVPLATLPQPLPAGTIMRNFQVSTATAVGFDPSTFKAGALPLSPVDNALSDSKTFYVAGSPSCIAIGK
jgi:hypothetical protein